MDVLTCGDCGAQNSSDADFCGGCGAYLEWDAQTAPGPSTTPAEPDPEPAAPEEPVREPEPVGLLGRVRAAVGLEERTDESTLEPPEEPEAARAGDAPALQAGTAGAAEPLVDGRAEPERRPADAVAAGGGRDTAPGSAAPEDAAPVVGTSGPGTPETGDAPAREVDVVPQDTAVPEAGAASPGGAPDGGVLQDSSLQGDGVARNGVAPSGDAVSGDSRRPGDDVPPQADGRTTGAAATRDTTSAGAVLRDGAPESAVPDATRTAATASGPATTRATAHATTDQATTSHASPTPVVGTPRDDAAAARLLLPVQDEGHQREAVGPGGATARAGTRPAREEATRPGTGGTGVGGAGAGRTGARPAAPGGGASGPVRPGRGPTGGASSRSGGASAGPGAPAGSATAGTAPQPDLGPVRPDVTPVRPGHPDGTGRRPVTQVQAEGDRPRPGDVVCGGCGTGNVPSRRFCRRCGESLADAPVVPPRPWWQRLLRRERTGPVAGTRDRPRRRRRAPRGLVPLVLLLVLATVGWTARGLAAPVVDPVLDRVRGTELVNPQDFKASSEARGHGAALLRDGATNRSWAPTGTAEGAWVEAQFPSPRRLVSLVVHTGASTDPTAFFASGRPTRVRVALARPGQPLDVRDVDLRDEPGRQVVDVGVSGVSAVRLTVLEAQGARPGGLVALGEVEFLARR